MRSLFVLLLCAAALCAPAAAAERYDVSYLWSAELAGVLAYREKVAGVLGPAAAEGLMVVRGAENYGLVYPRRGDRDSTERVAKTHSRLLEARGLEAAAVVEAAGWKDAETDDDPDLEAAVEAFIKARRRDGTLRPGERTAWVVYDFLNEEKLVSINEDVPMEAASLIKPFIALAYFHEVAAGRRRYGPSERRRMEAMIQRSDNPATNWLLRRLGGPARVQELLKREYGGVLADLSLVEYIPRGGRTYRNKASAHDYSRFLFALWNGDLPRSEEIRRLMHLPGRDRIYTGAKGVPAGTEVYNKTGSTARLCGDMGILVAEDRNGEEVPYIVVGLIEAEREAAHYSRWIRRRGDVIRGVSDLVYKAMADRHGLKGSLASR